MKLLAIALAALAVGAAPSKTVRLTIIHTVKGCHIWQSSRALGPETVIRLPVKGAIELRINCPMDFALAQVRGPKLRLGDPTMHTGTSRRIVFPKRGLYVIQATNLQSSTELGLQTLGPDNGLRLTVRVG